MRTNIQIGLVGDYDATVPADQAIPVALQLAADALVLEIRLEWVPTEERFATLRGLPVSTDFGAFPPALIGA